MADTNETRVKLTNVRLSYPNLFRPKAGKGSDGKPTEPKYSAVFLMDKVKNAQDINNLRAAAKAAKTAKWLGKPVNLTGSCLREGTEKEATDGYGPSVMFISTSSKTRPGVVDQRLQSLAEDSGKPYAGCFVNATVRVWAQDNQFGKRLNWELCNVQFVRDGEPFGEKRVAAEKEFTEIAEDNSSVDESSSKVSADDMI